MNRLLAFWLLALTCPAAAAAQPYVDTLLAGARDQRGSADGRGAQARFISITAMAFDAGGNLCVADSGAIRRVTSAGHVTTLAGVAGSYGYRDGLAANARFSNEVVGLAVAADGTVYVAERGTHVIRKVSLNGEVTTFAGATGSAGFKNGTFAESRFYKLGGLVVDPTGAILAADTGNRVIRKLEPSGVVSTLIGPIPDSPNSSYLDEPYDLYLDQTKTSTSRTCLGGMAPP